MRRCLHPGCQALTPNTRCASHQREHSTRRGPYPYRQALRERTLQRLGSFCAICGAGPLADRSIHIDHVRPISAFPPNTPREVYDADHNLRVLCVRCNLRKGTRPDR